MEVIFNRQKASNQLALAKTDVADLLVAKPS